MRKIVAFILAGGALVSAGAAQAQSWGVWVGSRPAYDGYERRADSDDWARAVCSGARAHGLEDRLRHEREEGEIGRDTAGRIHDAIDGLEDRARRECNEGDRRGIWSVSQRYNGIQRWIDSEAHGDWRGGW